jgi:PIN domain nuclease of toxin-antitoxin system
MIVLVTHVWVWWVHGDAQITPSQSSVIKEAESAVIGVSAISCWEVAKLVERGRLILPRPVDEWLSLALDYPGVRLIELSPEISVASTRLPGDFHRDPADQIIVATARVNDCSLVTSDQKIISYEHVETVS